MFCAYKLIDSLDTSWLIIRIVSWCNIKMTVLFIARGLKVDNIKLPVFKQVFLTSPVD